MAFCTAWVEMWIVARILPPSAYDPVANAWTTKASLPQTRVYARAAAANGSLYIFGGSRSFDGAVFAYNPTNDTWTSKAPMPTPRNLVSVAVASGLIYVMGGITSAGIPLSLVEIYDPSTDTWRTGTPMPSPRASHCAAVLNGLIYVVGGDNTNALATADAYNPLDDTWGPVPPMPVARNNCPAATANGVLYVFGGYSPTEGYTSSMVAFITNSTNTPFSFDTSPASLQMGPDGFHLRLLGSSGGPVVIQASSDLRSWTPIYTNPPAAGSFDFIDSSATNHPARYYRAVAQ
jgi:hypothetical protein